MQTQHSYGKDQFSKHDCIESMMYDYKKVTMFSSAIAEAVTYDACVCPFQAFCLPFNLTLGKNFNGLEKQLPRINTMFLNGLIPSYS